MDILHNNSILILTDSGFEMNFAVF